MAWWLQILEPGHPSRVVTVDGPTEVGRDCDGIVIDDPTVSRRHLTVEPAPTGVHVVDLGSANGTRVDGERMGDPVTLEAGTRLQIGETELVVVEGRDTAGGAPVESAPVDPADRPSEAVRRLSKAGRGGPSAAASAHQRLRADEQAAQDERRRQRPEG